VHNSYDALALAIYGQWLQMNKATNSFDKLHCRLFIIELRAEARTAAKAEARAEC